MDKQGLFIVWMADHSAVDYEDIADWLESTLKKLAMRRRGTTSADVDDIVQECIAKLLSTSSVRIDGARTYLRQVVRTAASEHFQNMGMARFEKDRHTLSDIASVNESELPYGPEARVERYEMRDQLRPVAERITRDDWRLCRAVIRSDSIREASRTLGRSNSATQKRWGRLIEKAKIYAA